MATATAEPVFSIPFRYLWNTNFAGDLEVFSERPTGLAQFVGDQNNQILHILSDECPEYFFTDANRHVWPLVLFGATGTGKTSLAINIISDISQRQASRYGKHKPGKPNDKKPIVLTSLDFDRRFRSALETNTVTDFRRRLLSSAGLVIDDVEKLAKKSAAQNELLLLIDQMLVRNRPLVLTMGQDPLLCDSLMPRLASRLSGGLSLPVNPPGPEARDAIIRDLCNIHDLNLTEDAVQLLTQQLNVAVPRIVQFFNQLKITLASQCDTDGEKMEPANPVDSAWITRMFERSDSDLRKFAKIIIDQVAAEFHVKRADLRGSSRKQSIVRARGVAIYLNRKLLGTSFSKIGSLFGNRDHSTIMHSNRNIEKLIAESATDHPTDQSVAIKNTVEKLEQTLTNLFANHISFV